MHPALSDNVTVGKRCCLTFCCFKSFAVFVLAAPGSACQSRGIKEQQSQCKKNECVDITALVFFFSTETSKRVRPYAVIKQRLAEALHVLP